MYRRVLDRRGFACGLMAVLLFWCPPLWARTSSEQYALAVAQLRKDGFKGIDRALEQFEALIRDDPAFTEAYVGAADALLVKYEFSKKRSIDWMHRARKYLDIALARQPRQETFYFKRALVLLNLGALSRAEDDLEKAVALNPAFLKAQVLYLQVLLSSGREREARRMADKWLAGYGDDPAPRKYFGDVFFQARAYADALVFYKQVIRRVERAPHTLAAMGKAYQATGRCTDAIAAFRLALKQDPKLYPVHFGLGTCLAQQEDLEGAIDQYQRYLARAPGDAAALNNLALLYERTGRKARAQVTWMKLKRETQEDVYRQRAERHLYRLAYENPGERDSGGEKSGSAKGKGASEGAKP